MATLMLLAVVSHLLAFLLMGQGTYLSLKEEKFMTFLSGICFASALFLFTVPFVFGSLYAGGFSP